MLRIKQTEACSLQCKPIPCGLRAVGDFGLRKYVNEFINPERGRFFEYIE